MGTLQMSSDRSPLPEPTNSAENTPLDNADNGRQEYFTSVRDDRGSLQDLLAGLPETIALGSCYAADINHPPEGNEGLGWQNGHKLAQKYDRELCQAHREQIDTLLVFAGLFSAVVTAFAIESYQWLQDDPAEISADLLRDVVALLAQNTNHTVLPPPTPKSRLNDAAVIRINIFWFLSLSLSLSAALVGILCKQWLREYERDVGQSPETALAVRHIRFSGLEYWKVGTIVTSVPIVLQLALALFLIGVMDLLWRLHVTVAGYVTVVAALTLAFYLATTFLPLLQYISICIRCCGRSRRTINYSIHKAFALPQCAFKSAQAWLILRMAQPVIQRCLDAYAFCFNRHEPPRYLALVLRPADSWVTFDINWMKRRGHSHRGAQSAYESLAWISENLEETDSSAWIWHCVWAHLRGNVGYRYADYIERAAVNIERVSESYPAVVRPDSNVSATVRAHAFAFRCSLRTDLPINTAIELVLRIAPRIGVDSRWTREALQSVLHVYRETRFRIDDDVAVGMIRLAELLTEALIHNPPDDGPEPLPDPIAAFLHMLILLHRGSRYADRLQAAMCALALRWFRTRPFKPVESGAHRIMQHMLSYLVDIGYTRNTLRHFPGVLFVAELARAIAVLRPDFPITWYLCEPYHQQLLLELLAMAHYDPASGSGAIPAPELETLATAADGPPSPLAVDVDTESMGKRKVMLNLSVDP